MYVSATVATKVIHILQNIKFTKYASEQWYENNKILQSPKNWNNIHPYIITQKI